MKNETSKSTASCNLRSKGLEYSKLFTNLHKWKPIMAKIEQIAARAAQVLLNVNAACDQGTSCGAVAFQSTAPLWGSLHLCTVPALGSSLLCTASEYLEDEPFEAFSLTALQRQLYFVWTRLGTYTLFCYSSHTLHNRKRSLSHLS